MLLTFAEILLALAALAPALAEGRSQRNLARHHRLVARQPGNHTLTARSLEQRATCAPAYSSKVTIRGTGTLPVATSFVTRKGNQFLLNGAAFPGHGANIYWLAVDENGGPRGPTDHGRIREILAAAVAMGASTVRAQSLGISVGSSYSIWPAPNAPNEANLRQVDYAIAAAKAYGLRLIIPLCDNYNYYVGGKYTFLGWTGASQANNGAAFYSDRNTINLFKQYITTVINRRNVYTGIRNGDEPSIMAWETGNEYGAYALKETVPSAAWTSEIASLIRSLAPKQLIIDGTDGVFYPSNGAVVPGASVSNVDVLSDHQYPPNSNTLATDAKYASKYSKALVLGEYDWTKSGLSTWLNNAAKARAPTMFWSLFGRDAQCCNYVTHQDGYSLYYPNGPNSNAEKANIQAMTTFMWKQNHGKNVNYLPNVACPQPVIFNSTVG